MRINLLILLLMISCGKEESKDEVITAQEEILAEPEAPIQEQILSYERDYKFIERGIYCTAEISFFENQYQYIDICKDYALSDALRAEEEIGTFEISDGIISFTPLVSSCSSNDLAPYEYHYYEDSTSVSITEGNITYTYTSTTASYFLSGETMIKGCLDNGVFTED